MEQTAKFNKDMIVINEVYQEQINQNFDVEENDKAPLEPIHFDPVIFSNYNIPFKDNSDSELTKLCI